MCGRRGGICMISGKVLFVPGATLTGDGGAVA